MAFSAGKIWYGNPAGVYTTYPATGGGGGITVADGSLWIANAETDSIWREPLR